MTITATRDLSTPSKFLILFVSWGICGLGALFYCYEYLLRVSPSVMTHDLMRYYHLTGAQYGNLSGSFYYYSYVVMQIVVGLLLDRYGPRRLLTLACLLCAVGAFLFACSAKLEIAMLGRFLIGFGSAFAFVGSAKLATIWLPPNRFALVSGIIFCLGMLGAMCGQILLRWFVDNSGWQATTYGAAVIGLLLSGLLWTLVGDVNPYEKEHYSNFKPTLKEVFKGFFKVIKNPQMWFTGIMGCLLYLFLSAFAELWGPAYLEQGHSIARASAASANSMIFFGCAFGAPFWGWFSDLIGKRKSPIVYTALSAMLCFCILIYVPNLSLVAIYLILFTVGFLGSCQILVFAIARELTPIEVSGTAIGLMNMLVMSGGIIFPPIVGKLLDLNWHITLLNGARIYSNHAFSIALSIIPACIILGCLVTIFIRETNCIVFSENKKIPFAKSSKQKHRYHKKSPILET